MNSLSLREATVIDAQKLSDIILEILKDTFSEKPKNENIEIRTLLGTGNNQYIQEKEYRGFFESPEEAFEHIQTIPPNRNIYFGVATRNNKTSGKAKDISTFYCLGFDYDSNKDLELNIDIVKDRFNQLGLEPHYINETGGGFHAYLLIEPSKNLLELKRIIKAIGTKTNADPKALTIDQILRVPYTYNNKYSPPKLVTCAYKSKHTRYKLDYLKRAIGLPEIQQEEEHKQTSRGRKAKEPETIFNIDKACIRNMFRGVEEGNRNFALGRLTSYLKQQGYKKEKAWEEIYNWNKRNKPSEEVQKLSYDFEKYWHSDYKLLGCVINNPELQSMLSEYCNREQCSKAGRIAEIRLDNSVGYNNRIFNKYSAMTGNDLIVYGILLRHSEGLSSKQLKEKLISKATGQSCISKPVLLRSIKDLKSNGFIEAAGNNKSTFYKAIPQGTYGMGYTIVSNGALNGAIDNRVTATQFKLYVLLLKYSYTKDSCYPSEIDLAKELRTSQQRVSENIIALESSDYIKIIKSYNEKGAEKNIYKLLV